MAKRAADMAAVAPLPSPLTTTSSTSSTTTSPAVPATSHNDDNGRRSARRHDSAVAGDLSLEEKQHHPWPTRPIPAALVLSPQDSRRTRDHALHPNYSPSRSPRTPPPRSAPPGLLGWSPAGLPMAFAPIYSPDHAPVHSTPPRLDMNNGVRRASASAASGPSHQHPARPYSLGSLHPYTAFDNEKTVPQDRAASLKLANKTAWPRPSSNPRILPPNYDRDVEKEGSFSSSIRSSRLGQGSPVVHIKPEDDSGEDFTRQGNTTAKALLYLCTCSPFASLLFAIYTILAILVLALTYPFRVCFASERSFSTPAISWLAPPLRLQLHWSCTPPIYDVSDQNCSLSSLILVHLAAPFISITLALAGWVVTSFWILSAMVSEPGRVDDGKDLADKILLFWERWLVTAVRSSARPL